MHDLLFAKSFNPAPAIVLRLPLETYTIGHEMALLQRDNPLVFYRAESFKELPAADQDIALRAAVLLCSKRLPRWGRLWSLWADRLFGPAEIDKFYAYREAAMADLPTTRMPRVQGVPHHYYGAPELARLLNYVTEHHSLLIQAHFKGTPLNFPLGLARMLYSTHLECEGQIWVKNHHDEEFKARHEAWKKLHPEGTIYVGDEAVQKASEQWNKDFPDCPVPLPNKPKGKT
jgi:hypothetical protein